MKILLPNNQRGYIALIAVLIISAVTLAIALSLSGLGVSETDTGLLRQQSAQAGTEAQSCLQEAELRLMNNQSYAGGTVMTFDIGTCTVTTVTTSGTDRIIDVSSTVNSVSRQFEGRVTTSANGLTPVYWKELH